jgi:Ser/Thr protein kinase RdoA (MazF antagonist)
VPAPTRVSAAQAAGVARRQYGVSGHAQRLAAELDDVFRLTAADGSVRLLRIGLAPAGTGLATAGTGAAPEAGQPAGAGVLSLPTAVLVHLAAVAPGLPVQRVVAAGDGRLEVPWSEDGHPRLVRMTTWLNGELLSQGDRTAGLRRDLGATLGRLNIALRGFRHPGARRTHRWDLQNFCGLGPLLAELPADGTLPEVGQVLAAGGSWPPRPPWPAGGLRAELADCLDRFGAVVVPRLARTPVQVVHTDFHGENLLTDGKRITGILDFGDALTGPVAMDLGVAACYQLGRGPDLLAPALDVVAGYHAADPLGPGDLDLVAEFMLARVAARIIVSQWNAVREPANRGYLLRRTPQAITQFAALRRLTPEETGARLRAACGM